MALYHYYCFSGHDFDALVPVKKRNDFQTCPICGDTARRQLTAPAIHAEPSGDGYVINKETNLTSKGLPKKTRWV
jgi:putative FmdB family regulatory protein